MRQERSAHVAYGCRAWQKDAAQKETLSSRLPTMHSHPPNRSSCPFANAHLHAGLVAQGPALGAVRQPLRRGATAGAALALASHRSVGDR